MIFFFIFWKGKKRVYMVYLLKCYFIHEITQNVTNALHLQKKTNFPFFWFPFFCVTVWWLIQWWYRSFSFFIFYMIYNSYCSGTRPVHIFYIPMWLKFSDANHSCVSSHVILWVKYLNVIKFSWLIFTMIFPSHIDKKEWIR